MNYSIYLRELFLSDAKISFKWRNNPLIWKYTGSKPDKIITEEMELDWLTKKLSNANDHRFAICLKKNSQYIGNVQLLNVHDKTAEFHLFIGETAYWGMGIGKQATALILNFAFSHLNLDSVFLEVHPENKTALSVYKKIGFTETGQSNEYLTMIFKKDQLNISNNKNSLKLNVLQ